MEMKNEDVKVEGFRKGTMVNETDVAVRVTHIPTGVIVEVSDYPSRHQNEAVARRMLKEKIEKMGVLCDEGIDKGKVLLG